ncbi:MAG TPA: hypothetical protein VFB07_11835 [Vicinamibacterales bacterium]|nr:hypothetical protein [Vicinamibacterales bacterium]
MRYGTVGVLTLSVVSGVGGTGAEMQRLPQFDNARAGSWTSVIPPHTESTYHRHDHYRAVVAISGGDLKTITPEGKVTVTHYETGKSYWFEPMPPGETHKDVNDTAKTITVVTVELK